MNYKRDTILLSEVYQSIYLRDNITNMTFSQLSTILENASPSELDVLEEFLGGFKNVLGGGVKSAKAAGQAVKDKATAAGQAVKKTVGAAGQSIKAGAQQVGKNVKDMYNTGEAQAAADIRVITIKQQIQALEKLLKQHIDSTKGRSKLAGEDIKNLSLGRIQQALDDKADSAKEAAGIARDKGFFGGAGQAMKDTFNSSQ